MQDGPTLMRAEESTEGARGVIARAVKNRFPDGVDSVFVGTDSDLDGDRIYRIYVAFNEYDPARYGKRLSGFLPYLRDTLLATNDDGFPVLSFMSREDLTRLKLERP